MRRKNDVKEDPPEEISEESMEDSQESEHPPEEADEGEEEGEESPVSGASPSTPVAPPLTSVERLRLVESKVDSIGHALHSLITLGSIRGHDTLESFVDEWKIFTAGIDG